MATRATSCVGSTPPDADAIAADREFRVDAAAPLVVRIYCYGARGPEMEAQANYGSPYPSRRA